MARLSTGTTIETIYFYTQAKGNRSEDVKKSVFRGKHPSETLDFTGLIFSKMFPKGIFSHLLSDYVFPQKSFDF
ncbi:MAG: hypothetical protein QME42_11220 [bacterium]|nr:hypothetical protein [bacterium]